MESDERRLDMPIELRHDPNALEFISVWHHDGKMKVMTRSGTRLDERLEIWSEIVLGVIENIADHASTAELGSSDVVKKIVSDLHAKVGA